MVSRLLLLVSFLLFVLGCGGSGAKNPVNPGNLNSNHGLALYQMTFTPSVVVHVGDRAGQAHRFRLGRGFGE